MPNLKSNTGPSSFADILHKRKVVKPPAYQWQEFALRIISELGIPKEKKNSVFRVAKTMPKHFVESCLNETKELAKTGQSWRYFFKLTGQYGKKDPKNDNTA